MTQDQPQDNALTPEQRALLAATITSLDAALTADPEEAKGHLADALLTGCAVLDVSAQDVLDTAKARKQ